MREGPGWRARWSESTAPIRRHWHRERLRLHGLTGPERLIAILAVGVIVVACGIVVASSLGAMLPGRVADVPGRTLATPDPVPVPVLVVVLGCFGLAVAAAAIAAGSVGRGWSAGRMFAIVVLSLAGLGGLLLAIEGAVAFHAGLVDHVNTLVLPLYRITTAFALLSALLLLAAPISRSRWVRAAAPMLAAFPFLGIAATVVVAGDSSATIAPWVQAQSLDYPPRLDLNATIFGPILFVVGSASGLIALLAIWQASEFSKAAVRHVGTALAVSATRWTGLLAALLVAKGAWLAAGIAGALPPALGGASGLWPAIRSDDAFAWAYAAALVAGGGFWLLRDRRRISEERATGAAGRTVLGFAAATFVVTALPLLAAAFAGELAAPRASVPGDVALGDCFGTWLPLGASAGLSCLALALVPWQGIWWLLVIAGSLAGGLWLLRRSPNHGAGIFLTALGAWGLPRALDAVRSIHPGELKLLGGLPEIDAPQPETLDVAVTVLVAVLAVAWWAGRQRRIGNGSLLVILAVSTLLIDGPALAPSAPGALLVAIGIVFPVLYELGFDSGRTNRPRPDRSGALLQNLGLRALALTVLAMLLIVDIVGLQESTQARLAFILFGVPLSATIVAATVRRRHRVAQSGVAPMRRRLVTGAAVGLTSVVALGALGWVLQPGLAGFYPTPAARVQELQTRFAALDASLQHIDVFDPATPAALDHRWVDERDWTASHPAPSCAAPAWSSWSSLISDVRRAGIVIAAVTDPPAGAPETEVAAVQAALERVGASLEDDVARLRTRLEEAARSC